MLRWLLRVEWEILITTQVEALLDDLYESDPVSHQLVNQAILVLDRNGPAEGRPLVDSVTASRIANMKELRPPSSGRSEVRILLVFDPWRSAVLQAWDRQCAFCGYDGQVAGASAAIDAAHVRWFTFDGPDTLDNGLALCVLHHKLFDLGALGLDLSLKVLVSGTFTARTPAGRAVYELHGRPLSPRPGTITPHHLALARSVQRQATGCLN